MSLLSQMTLIEPLTYLGRHRTYVKGEGTIFQNQGSHVEYELFEHCKLYQMVTEQEQFISSGLKLKSGD